MQQAPVGKLLEGAAVRDRRLTRQQDIKVEVAMSLGCIACIAAMAQDRQCVRLLAAQAGYPTVEEIGGIHGLLQYLCSISECAEPGTAQYRAAAAEH